jgi:hypothetical protein
MPYLSELASAVIHQHTGGARVREVYDEGGKDVGTMNLIYILVVIILILVALLLLAPLL